MQEDKKGGGGWPCKRRPSARGPSGISGGTVRTGMTVPGPVTLHSCGRGIWASDASCGREDVTFHPVRDKKSPVLNRPSKHKILKLSSVDPHEGESPSLHLTRHKYEEQRAAPRGPESISRPGDSLEGTNRKMNRTCTSLGDRGADSGLPRGATRYFSTFV